MDGRKENVMANKLRLTLPILAAFVCMDLFMALALAASPSKPESPGQLTL